MDEPPPVRRVVLQQQIGHAFFPVKPPASVEPDRLTGPHALERGVG